MYNDRQDRSRVEKLLDIDITKIEDQTNFVENYDNFYKTMGERASHIEKQPHPEQALLHTFPEQQMPAKKVDAILTRPCLKEYYKWMSCKSSANPVSCNTFAMADKCNYWEVKTIKENVQLKNTQDKYYAKQQACLLMGELCEEMRY